MRRRHARGMNGREPNNQLQMRLLRETEGRDLRRALLHPVDRVLVLGRFLHLAAAATVLFLLARLEEGEEEPPGGGLHGLQPSHRGQEAEHQRPEPGMPLLQLLAAREDVGRVLDAAGDPILGAADLLGHEDPVRHHADDPEHFSMQLVLFSPLPLRLLVQFSRHGIRDLLLDLGQQGRDGAREVLADDLDALLVHLVDARPLAQQDVAVRLGETQVPARSVPELVHVPVRHQDPVAVRGGHAIPCFRPGGTEEGKAGGAEGLGIAEGGEGGEGFGGWGGRGGG